VCRKSCQRKLLIPAAFSAGLNQWSLLNTASLDAAHCGRSALCALATKEESGSPRALRYLAGYEAARRSSYEARLHVSCPVNHLIRSAVLATRRHPVFRAKANSVKCFEYSSRMTFARRLCSPFSPRLRKSRVVLFAMADVARRIH